ncbi:MAG: histidine phosphatase family protein, partial [Trichococcus flocculiformis]
MKRLYLVRHGETLFNTQGKIQGWSDSPLTERGIKQAQAVRDYFGSEGIRFDHAYSSTSERASDTLELITGMPYARLKGLKEVNYGFFEG